MTYTASDYADSVDRYDGLELLRLLDTGRGSGIILSRRRGAPSVLGFAVVDHDGETGAIALDEEEATALRDALTAWLEGVR